MSANCFQSRELEVQYFGGRSAKLSKRYQIHIFDVRSLAPREQRDFLTVTVQYVKGEDLHSRVLATNEIENKTAAGTRADFANVLDTFGFQQKVRLSYLIAS